MIPKRRHISEGSAGAWYELGPSRIRLARSSDAKSGSGVPAHRRAIDAGGKRHDKRLAEVSADGPLGRGRHPSAGAVLLWRGTIMMISRAGEQCAIPYVYDQAMDKLKLYPLSRFTQADIDWVMMHYPNYTKALALLDIMDKKRICADETGMLQPSPAADRSMCGLSGGR